jgi:multisubunit Na+/H+ antiporter MnhF subunit
VNGWLWAATVLLTLLLPCVLVAARSTYAGALAAVQPGGAATALALMLLTVGYARGVYANLALVLAVVNWIGSLVYARFLARL